MSSSKSINKKLNKEFEKNIHIDEDNLEDNEDDVEKDDVEEDDVEEDDVEEDDVEEDDVEEDDVEEEDVEEEDNDEENDEYNKKNKNIKKTNKEQNKSKQLNSKSLVIDLKTNISNEQNDKKNNNKSKKTYEELYLEYEEYKQKINNANDIILIQLNEIKTFEKNIDTIINKMNKLYSKKSKIKRTINYGFNKKVQIPQVLIDFLDLEESILPRPKVGSLLTKKLKELGLKTGQFIQLDKDTINKLGLDKSYLKPLKQTYFQKLLADIYNNQ